MEGNLLYPVDFECPELLPCHQKAVERYFQNRRKSGGGECGPLRKNNGVYTLTFVNQKDQREVLKKKNHEVELGNTLLRFTVREGQSPHSSPQTSHTQQTPDRPKPDCGTTPKAFASLPSDELQELHLDCFLLRYLKDCPKARKQLNEQLATLHCTAELYSDDERVLVRRCSQREARDSVDTWKTELGTIFETLKSDYCCHFETDAHRIKALLESRGLQTEDEDVKVYSEGGVAVVVGERAQVRARLNVLQEKPMKTKSVTLHFGEDKLRLLWGRLEHGLNRDFPKVKATREEGGQLVLQGSAADVLKADEFVAQQVEMVVERKLSNFKPGFLAFWRKAFDAPGSLSDYLGLGVEIEIQETELHVFSFSADRLDQTERALRREFALKEFPIANLNMVYSLIERTKPTLQKMNRNGRRVECVVLASTHDIVYLVGHAKEVEELSGFVPQVIESLENEHKKWEEERKSEELADRTLKSLRSFDLHQSSPPALLPSHTSLQENALGRQEPHHFSSLCVDQEEAEVVARYDLTDELVVFVCLGDITKQEADALVNAANEDLKHSGGVAAALSNAGGPEVQRESSDLVKTIGKISTGDVVVTSGGTLKCKKLLHAVGPVNGKAGGRERLLIQKAVTSALNLCEIMDFTSIAVPCISSGVFGVPVDVSAEAIVSAVRAFGAAEGRSLTKITLMDNRREVVRSLKAQCDRLLLRDGADGDTQGTESLETQTGAAVSGISQKTVKVQIVQGTIENQQVDAVVCPMVGGDLFSTRVGSCLYEKVGPQLMDLYKKQNEDGKDVLPGDTLLLEGLTGAAFSAVFFVDLLPWDNDPSGTTVEILKFAVSNVLTCCENRGFTSVAFPVLGAGVLLRFPEKIVTQVLYEEFCNFDQRHTSTTPFLVNIVCPSGDQMFEKIFSSTQESLALPISQESEPKRIILLGKTGSGKSSLGNTILGENAFEADDSPNSGTKQCQSKTKMVRGRNITLIDTPGLFDSERSEEELMPEILSCVTESAPGPHAFLIVLKVEKFSQQEQAIITKICQYFSEEALQYATIVFTHGDQLPKGTDIETFIKKSKHLDELVRKCGNRCHVVDNTYWNADANDPYRNNQLQVEALLKTIDKMVVANNWGFYTNKAFNAMEKDIQKEVAIIKEKNDCMTKEELRSEAKKRVSNRWLISLAGIGTGALLGAIFGVEALVRLVVAAVQNTVVMKGAQRLKSAVGLATAGETAMAIAGAAVGVAGLTGGVAGGVIGGMESDKAESVQEAVERATQAVMSKREEGLRKINQM